MPHESTSLLSNQKDKMLNGNDAAAADSLSLDQSDPHAQFCALIGIPPSFVAERKDILGRNIDPRTLYARATRKRCDQVWAYTFTAALSNTLLLAQVVLGATLTALGASSSSHILITIFGVINTIVAGIVAYLKSRGQPMRARMFRDDLEHVVEEIENSKIMWLGIRDHVHGYSEIDTDDKISVRSEVARLTRLYESALKKYINNNPDMYNAGSGALDPIGGLRAKPGPAQQVPGKADAGQGAANGQAGGGAVTTAQAPAVDDADESPATAKTIKPDKPTDNASGKNGKDAKGAEEDQEKGESGGDGTKKDKQGSRNGGSDEEEEGTGSGLSNGNRKETNGGKGKGVEDVVQGANKEVTDIIQEVKKEAQGLKKSGE